MVRSFICNHTWLMILYIPKNFQENLREEYTKFHQCQALKDVYKNSMEPKTIHLDQKLAYLVVVQNGIIYIHYPICSTISLALVMMSAPVQQTIPAISIEYQRAL